MSLRNKIFLAAESFLRVPPLLLMDEIFRYSFGLGFGSKLMNSGINLVPVQKNDAPQEEGIFDTAFISGDGEQPEPNQKNTNWLSGAQPSLDQLWKTVSFDAFFPSSAEPQSATSDNFDKSSIVDANESSGHFLHIGVGEWSSYPQGVTNELLTLIEVLGCMILFTALLVVFVLSTENLIKLYSLLVSYLTLYMAYIFTPFPSLWSSPFIPVLGYNLFVRFSLSSLYFLTRSWPLGNPTDTRHGFPAILDTLTFALFFFTGLVHFDFSVFVILVIFLQYSVWARLPEVYNFLNISFADTKRVRNEFGISHLIQVESGRLRINTVFRLFWCSKAAYDALYHFSNGPTELVFKQVVTHGTETLTGIIGLTVTVSAICHQIGELLLWVLYCGTNSETDANRFGSISTVLFLILSLQTGLTSLDPEKRLDRLLKNIALLGTALLHALHQMLAPLLHAFRTFQALQIRAVVLSFSFLSLSVISTIYLIRSSAISTWSLAVLALAIEFKIKIIVSLFISIVVYLSQLVQYPEFMQKMGEVLRNILPQSTWRTLCNLHDQVSHEDMVFYLKAFASVAEFITGIFLFVNAVWIFLFESASAIRAIGMSIHAYFNIWCESRKGWKIYCQRRTAAMKIMSLSDATEDQLLQKKDDVCSICYEGMESAKVTHCGHLFHAVCLRKWLYIQNNCPLCHEILYNEESQENSNDYIVVDRVEVPPAADPQEEIRDPNIPLLVGNPPGSNPGGSRGPPGPFNGIRLFDLLPAVESESDIDVDDDSSDNEDEIDEFSDAGDGSDDNDNGNSGLVAFL